MRVQDETTIRRTFERDSILLIEKSPFIGGVLMGYSFSSSLNTPLADFDNKKIYLNGSTNNDDERLIHIYAELNKETRVSILYYIALHIILEHFKIPTHYHETLARLSQDISAFNMLPQFRQSYLTALSPNFNIHGQELTIPLPTEEGEVNFKLKLPEVITSWEAVYNSLRDSSLDLPSEFLTLLTKYYNTLALSHVKPCDISDEDLFRLRVRVTSLEKNAQYGEISGQLLDYIDSLHQSKVSWITHVKEFISEALTKMNYSWYPPNYRKMHLGYLPSRKGTGVKDIRFIVDTSGSMDIKEIEQGVSELLALREATPCRIHFACCDAEIYDWITIEPNQPFDVKDLLIVGRGGTDFQPIFANIDEGVRKGKHKKPAGVIVVTDGDGGFPVQKPDYPVLWVSTVKKSSDHYPFGKVINLES